jgi:hypothetical protein
MPTPTASGQTVTFFTKNSGVANVDALVSGTKWGGAQGTSVILTYSIPTAAAVWLSPYSSDNKPTGFTPLNSTQATQFRVALQGWANVANITFQEVIETPTLVGDIRVAFSPAIQASGFTGVGYYPSSNAAGGDIWLNPSDSSLTSPTPGSYGFATLVHELGHTLGLDHPLGVGNSPGFSEQTSIMSYNPWPNSLFRDVTDIGGGGFSWTYEYISTSTPSIYDVAAIQYMYGANKNYNAGNNTYTFSPTTPFLQTIWDGGGNDTISISNFSTNSTINLNGGQFSSIVIPSDPLPPGATENNPGIYDGTNNLGIAFGVVIENAIGGAGGDTLIGNAASNRLTGGAGNDLLTGAGGRDTGVYAVSSTAATRTHNPDGTWTINAGADGTDTLRNVEVLQFSNRKVVIEDPQTDFNADANSDLLWFRQSDGYAYLWTLNNNVQSGGNALGQIGAAWTIQTTGDFNGDGSSDFIWKNTTTGQFYIWNFANGVQSGGFNIGNIGTNWNVMGSGDFNADGTGDIVWRDSNTGQLYLWMMQNNAIASSTNLGSIGVDWTVQAVGDFNGDGTSDLALRNTSTGLAYLWNFSNGVLSGGNDLGTVATNWTIMGSGDFNADGTDDLAWRNGSNGNLNLWMMQNNSISSTSDLGTIGAQWTIDAISDANADGTSDLLLKNSSSGQFYIWDISNGVVSGGADLGLIGADWQLV